MKTFLTEWRGRDGKTYGGEVNGTDWDDAEKHCCKCMRVLGELVAVVECKGNVHHGTEVMQ